MTKKKRLISDQEIVMIIEKNSELIEALKNLNEKLICEKADFDQRQDEQEMENGHS